MRKLSIVILILSSFCVQAQDFYDMETVNTIGLIFVESNWDQLLDNLAAAGDEGRLTGTAVINGVQFDSAGVRYKGNSSYNPNQIKNPLNIKLDYIIENQNLDGYGTLKLANCYKDPSFIREVVSYEITRSCMPASQANFTNVYINGELIGLYSNVQSVDKGFIEDHFGSNNNAFFKGELAGMTPTLEQIWGYWGQDSSAYFNYYELRSDEGWCDLIHFLEMFNQEPDSMEAVLNIDRHLWMLAIDNLMINLDAPINFAHNYYLYQDNTGRFNPLIWDLNENFGAFSMLLTGGPPLNLTGMQQMNPFLNVSNPYYPIINRVLGNDTYAKRYIAHMKTIIEEFFSSGWYMDRAVEIQSIIDAAVLADPNKYYSYNDFHNNLYFSIGFGPQMVAGIEQLMEARINYLLNRPDFQAQAPIIGEINHAPATILQNTEFNITAEVENGNQVEFVYRSTGEIIFEHLQMFDDGLHGDGTADDNVYGAFVQAGWQNIEYYIYAENSAAVMFSPAKAEYEYYLLEVEYEPGSLFINEFMADNDGIIADPQGEFDDWLEIYNGGGETVNLAGMYLTDNLLAADKWAFPDTVLEAGGFIVVWADEDGGDEGLHANFRLSASGEEIGLAYFEGEEYQFLDQIVYESQETDISFGRYPDGGDDWGQLEPTPGSSNQLFTGIGSGSEIEIPDNPALLAVYPNPFNLQAVISFRLQAASQVELKVFDVTGREAASLVKGHLSLGYHEVVWDAGDWASGVYFVKLETEADILVEKLLLIK